MRLGWVRFQLLPLLKLRARADEGYRVRLYQAFNEEPVGFLKIRHQTDRIA